MGRAGARGSKSGNWVKLSIRSVIDTIRRRIAAECVGGLWSFTRTHAFYRRVRANYSPMTQTGSGSGVIERLRAPVAQAPSWQQ